MLYHLSISFIIAVAVSTVCCAADRNAHFEPYAEFIAGCSLLQRAPVAREAGRQASCYRQLQTITGISTDGILAFLEGIRNDPEKGKELYDVMRQVFSEAPDSLK